MLQSPIRSPLSSAVASAFAWRGASVAGDPSPTPMISLLSTDAAASGDRHVRNRSAAAAPTNNIVSFDTGDIRTATSTNVTTTKNYATVDGVLATRFEIANVANGLYLWSGSDAPPSGNYKARFKVRLNTGQGTKDFRYGNTVAGQTTVSISESAWTTINATFTASGSNFTNYLLNPGAGAATPYDLLVGEVQVYDDDGSALPDFSSEVGGWHFKPSRFSQMGAVRGAVKRTGNAIDLELTGSAVLKSPTWPSPKTFTEFSAVVAFKNRVGALGQVLVTETDATLGTTANTVSLGVAAAGTLSLQPVNQGTTAINVLGQGWHIVAMRLKTGNRQCFFHEIELNSSASAWSGFQARLLRAGGQTSSSPMKGDMVVLRAWDAYLSDEEIYAHVADARTKVIAAGETMGSFANFYIAEGDSRTALATSYAFLLGAAGEFTPNLFMRSFAVSGSTIATLNSRLASVQRVAAQAQMNGRRAIVSCWIGVNDAAAIVSSPTDYYNNNLKPIWAAYRATGAKLIVCTELTDNGTVAGYASARNTLNSLIRGDTSLYDALCDFASDPVMGTDDSKTTSPSNWTDNLHPTSAGHVLLKPYMRAAVAAVMA